VPDVVGDDHVAAGATVDGIDLIADSFPVESGESLGTVIEQDPAGGSEVPPRTHVLLAVSLGPGERATGTVPDVTGPNEVEARATDANPASRFARSTVPPRSPEERGEVILQRPAPGTTAPLLRSGSSSAGEVRLPPPQWWYSCTTACPLPRAIK
jgi:beta-lactam-binding protein with PASTA domain